MHVDPTTTVPVHRHAYAVIEGPEHARELSDRQAGSLLNRLHEDGADPHGAVRTAS